MIHIATSSNIKTEKRNSSSKQRLLSLYYEPPQIELTLDEFEMLSLDRLQLLRGIEVLKAKGDESSFNNKVNEVSVFIAYYLIFHCFSDLVGEEVHAEQKGF